ncbi:MAG TPA: 6-phosphogluconolactonase [archaeon]|nr:6-phosphogluconolactonase [archaeon]
MKPQVIGSESLEALSNAAADFLVRRAMEIVRAVGRFTLALSGGSTPQRLYEILARKPLKDRMPWQESFFFWGDERFVPADHPESNFRLAYRAMLSKVPVPESNIHPVGTGTGSAHEAAENYERDLQKFFGVNNKPRFDLVLLGLGADGHTASLFPGDPVLNERRHLAAAVRAPAQYAVKDRVTLTLPVLNSAACVLFLAAGREKKKMTDIILNQPQKAFRLYPAARIRPEDGELFWFTDREAH